MIKEYQMAITEESIKFYKCINSEPKGEVFIFGYGSLMSVKGIENRGLVREYKPSDFIPTTVKGLKRSISTTFGNVFYYGIKVDKNSEVNGTLIPINKPDLITLLHNEWAYPAKSVEDFPMYALYELNPEDLSMEVDRRVFTLINDPLKDNPVFNYETKRYIRFCWDNIEYLGEEFRSDFLRLGGIKP